ncbi:MAG: metallophosphoesterase family protein [Alphaproteobacteria bacterium]
MRFLLVSMLCAALAACAMPAKDPAMSTAIAVPDADTHHGEATPWTGLEALDAPEKFQFAVMTDRTGGRRPGIFPVGVDKVNLVQPAFVMSVGDLIQGYTKDTAQITAEWDEFDGMVEELDAPFFYVPGNHDMMNVEMEGIWKARFGASFYHFRYKDTLLLVLNSEYLDISDIEGASNDRTGGPGHDEWVETDGFKAARDAQFAYAEKVLTANPDVRWTFVFIHKPFWRSSWVYPPRDPETREFILNDYPVDGPYPTNLEVPADWQRLQDMLGTRDYTAFAGHRHSYDYGEFSDGPHTHEHITLATTGGGSRLRGLTYGEFDHVMWVTMTEDGPVFANLMLDGVQPKDFPQPDRSPWFVTE